MSYGVSKVRCRRRFFLRLETNSLVLMTPYAVGATPSGPTLSLECVCIVPPLLPLCLCGPGRIHFAAGILADEMGLGKTLQSISILAYMRDFQNVSSLL